MTDRQKKDSTTQRRKIKNNAVINNNNNNNNNNANEITQRQSETDEEKKVRAPEKTVEVGESQKAKQSKGPFFRGRKDRITLTRSVTCIERVRGRERKMF